ncbi:amino acid adenylation domain-containing protein [Streptomyces sp. GC420]|uniref:amino acid adenylation domain-containing protein n=1 Tax=Streptomyces sp. GC420 TaxID=2697568 RepID=UPI0037D9FA35
MAPSGAVQPPGTAGTDPAAVAAAIRRLLADALHRAPADVPDDEPFLAMGLDSLAAVDMVKQLERDLGRSLPTTLFFEFTTVRELAGHLSAEHLSANHLADGRGPGSRVADGPADAPPSGHAPPGAGGTTDAPFPLTPVQLAFHTNNRLYPDVSAYGYVRQTITGPLDADLLGRALDHLGARHPMLRMRLDGDRPPFRQFIAPPVPVTRWFEIRDTGGPPDEQEEALVNRPFDLRTEPPVRALLLRENAGTAHLVLVVHHAAADGYSLNILSQDLWSAYTALSRGRVPELTPQATGFPQYVAAVDSERSESVLEADRTFWRDRLDAPGEPCPLPFDGDPKALPAPPLAAHQAALTPALTAALHRRAAAHGVSLFHLLLAAHARCVARWSGQRRVVVNVARARREIRLAGVDRLVGPLADVLPLLVDTGRDEPVTALAERVRESWLECERHGSLTSPDLARLLPGGSHGPRTAGTTGFSFARFPVDHDPACPVGVRPTAAGTASAATRLSLLCWEDGPVLRHSWNYPLALFDRGTVEGLASHYLKELAELAEPAEVGRGTEPAAADAAGTADSAGGTGPCAEPVASAPATPDSGPAPSPEPAGPPALAMRPHGILRRLADRFRAAPDAIAIDTGATTMTYGELDRASAALAARLRARGVTTGDLVGLLTEPGVDTVVGLVGVLRAGAGWVPLDSTHPPRRLAGQLERCGVRTVVCDARNRTGAAQLPGVGPVLVDGSEAPGADAGPGPLPDRTDPDAIAYVIFTSGSTGLPKAVPITHRAMENYLGWALDTFGYHRGDRLAQTASICFDASVRQLLAPLLVGATVVTLPRHLVRDPELLLDHVVRARVTVWSSVPVLWERLLAAAEGRVRRGGALPDLSALRWVHVGGEALPPGHVRRWFDLLGGGQRIANLYGPTEATINATCHIIDARPGDEVRRLPIGRPVAGTEVRVADAEGRPCAEGTPGELLIAGTGLTPGYLGEPGLTAAAFTEHDGRRWYRSGDLARRTADGSLEYLGRVDDQVKIRGHRVEPGEIEAALETHEGVARAAVAHHDGRLAAFYVPRPGRPVPEPAGLRAHLARTLPDYMLPSRFDALDALPLTGTGKVDRRALRPDAAAETGAEGIGGTGIGGTETGGTETGERGERRGTPPQTPTERLLAGIWEELLNHPEVRRDDDFFALGGDSLLVLEVFARLEEWIPVLPRPTVIYTHGTLAALAAVIDAASASGAAVDAGPTAATARGSGKEARGDDGDRPSHRLNSAARQPASAGAGPTPYPLTPTQRGFLLAEALAPGSGSAWLARMRLRGPLRQAEFQRAVDALVERHAMLRTVFPFGERPPVQQELPPSMRLAVEFETLAVPGLLDVRIAEERGRRFEPWAWPLMRLRVFTVAPGEHVLVVHAHHLIGDGFSAALLGRELLAAYDRLVRGEPVALPVLRSTFRDYVSLLGQESAQEAPAAAGEPAAHAWRARLTTVYRAPVLRTDTGSGTHPGSGTGSGTHPGSGTGSAPPVLSAGFTLDAVRTEGLSRLASEAGATLYAPLLTAYYRALAGLTGRRDLVLGLAVTGRDHALPGINLLFGPLAAAVPLRPGAITDGPGIPDAPRDFAADLRRVVAEATGARMYAATGTRPGSAMPSATQFLFSYLDFSSLGPTTGETLALSWDDEDTELTQPPVGNDVFLTARPAGDGLRLTVRAPGRALTPASFAALVEAMHDDLAAATAAGARTPEAVRAAGAARAAGSAAGAPEPVPRRHGASRGPVVDAALVGYLPSPGHLAAVAGLPAEALPRETLRSTLFPDGDPRLLEEITTPLGSSGFVCLPLFADELAPGRALVDHTARAVAHAASLGARCVSLAGMIPAHTGYGFEVLRETRATATGAKTALTTGHAATAVSVVKTVHAALAATRRDLADLAVAVVGLGSIGRSSLELLLARAERPPAAMLLCDVAGSTPRLERLAGSLRDRGLAKAVRHVQAESVQPTELPAAVYEADLVITAVSAGGSVLDTDRLRPGTIVVDDSFPHCFDAARAVGRMRERGDIVVVGGGLFDVGDTGRRVAEGLPAAAADGYAAQPWLPGTMASCRLESLLHAHGSRSGSGLPLVHGLVDAPLALAYWDAVEAAGVRAGPLHLLGHTVDEAVLSTFPAPW